MDEKQVNYLMRMKGQKAFGRKNFEEGDFFYLMGIEILESDNLIFK